MPYIKHISTRRWRKKVRESWGIELRMETCRRGKFYNTENRHHHSCLRDVEVFLVTLGPFLAICQKLSAGTFHTNYAGRISLLITIACSLSSVNLFASRRHETICLTGTVSPDQLLLHLASTFIRLQKCENKLYSLVSVGQRTESAGFLLTYSVCSDGRSLGRVFGWHEGVGVSITSTSCCRV